MAECITPNLTAFYFELASKDINVVQTLGTGNCTKHWLEGSAVAERLITARQV